MPVAAIVALAVGAQPDPYDLANDPRRVRLEAVSSLIADLGKDPKTGKNAANRLVRIGKDAAPALIEALKSENVQVRFYAASALDLIAHPGSTQVMFDLMRDDDEHPMIRRIAVRAMGREVYRPAVPILIEFARAGAQRPTPEAAETGRTTVAARTEAPPGPDAPAEKPPLVKDEEFRFEVVRSLCFIGDSQAVDVLIDALKDESPRVREVAAQGLGDNRMPGAIGPLAKALEDDDGAVAAAAALSLAKFGKQAFDAAGVLIRALERQDVRVKRAATLALVATTGRSCPKAEDWRTWWESHLRTKSSPEGKTPPSRDTPAPPPAPTDEPAPRPTRPSGTPGATPPALRPPWEWDDEDWRAGPDDE